MSAAAIHDPTHAYRRDARKLRGRLACRPAELYRSLRQLSDQHDLIRNVELISRPTSTPTSNFAAEVRDFVQTEMLTYSARKNLLKSAEKHNIPRFEANLIIAAVQHRAPPRQIDATPPARNRSRLPFVAALILTQLALILAVYAFAAR